ncbi:MAG: hypothetical protein MI757_04125 [Pirellulales bacterium]|nr:hypothetical protein [Pirellulales bacterium]
MYRHTQTGYWGWVIWPVVGLQLWLAWYFRDQLWLSLLMLGMAAVVGVIALSFQSLTIQDEGDFLGICFGPIPLAYKRIDYDEIDRVERGQTKWIDGWGIHWVPGRGWTYNIRGFDCVKLTMGERTVRLGTDDPAGLLEMLERKVGARIANQENP